MRRAWFVACWAVAFADVAIACGGSNDSGLFGSSGDPNASSSGATSSSGTASSSGTTSSSGATSSSGTASSSGTTSSGGSSGTVAVDSGVDAGKSCGRDSSAQDCASNEYCKVTSCADKGVCTPKPDQRAQGDLVCGCDGISYWNQELAASFGVNVNPAFPSGCQGNAAKTCSGINPCPSNRFCNYQTTANGGICALTTAGTCWGMPNQCPNLTGGRAKECNTEECETFCEAVKAQKPWFEEQAQKCN